MNKLKSVSDKVDKALHHIGDQLSDALHVHENHPGNQSPTQSPPSKQDATPKVGHVSLNWSRPELVRLPYGDTLPDFSYAGCDASVMTGYLDNQDTMFTIDMYPTDRQRDRSADLAEAIHTLSERSPDANGWRGRVLLHPGTYTVACEGFDIRKSGIVITGYNKGTRAKLVCTSQCSDGTLFKISGEQAKSMNRPSLRHPIVDHHVAVGSRHLRVADLGDLRAGDSIRVVVTLNQKWIQFVGMNKIPARPDGGEMRQWGPFDLTFDRTIVNIHGLVLDLNVALTVPVSEEFGGAYLYKFDCSHFIRQVGIEHVDLECVTTGAKAEARSMTVDVCECHLERAVIYANARDCWLRDVNTVRFGFHTRVLITSRNITVTHCRYMSPSAKVEGAKRYGWTISGQMTLITHCTADQARHAYATDVRTCGPNVFHRCVSTNDLAESETHQKWANGVLFDVIEGPVSVQNRLWMGKGQGWSGAYCLVWNCRGAVTMQHPPGAWNFAIGSRDSMKIGRPHFPMKQTGEDSRGSCHHFVLASSIPESLYDYQLSRR